MEEEVIYEEVYDEEINSDELMDENLFDKIMDNVPIVEEEEEQGSPRLDVSHEEDLEELIDNYQFEEGEEEEQEIEEQEKKKEENTKIKFDEEDFKDVSNPKKI